MMCTPHFVRRCSSNSETQFSRVFPQHCSQHIPVSRAVDCAAVKIQRPRAPRKIASRKTRWLALSVDHDVADMLAEDLQIEFARGRSMFLRHARTEGTLWGSSWTRSRQLGASQSGRTVVGSRSLPLRRPWLWRRSAALRTSCRSLAPESGRSRVSWVVLQDSWRRQKRSSCSGPPLCAGRATAFCIVVERSARPSQVRRNLESCTRRAFLGCVFGRQRDAFARRRGRG